MARDWGISRRTMHDWLARYESDGLEGLGNRWPRITKTCLAGRDRFFDGTRSYLINGHDRPVVPDGHGSTHVIARSHPSRGVEDPAGH
ncbi:MAG TPA: leucine zipper domain-containing protein [Candidatus Dormibacteraeota bacterium]|nr:leucine zipper domain-containing protein [Candidatus Dormibacteraeota bacterium]